MVSLTEKKTECLCRATSISTILRSNSLSKAKNLLDLAWLNRVV